MIDRLAAHIPNAAAGFRLTFSPAPFPRATKFTWVRQEYGGNWYCDDAGNEGWLCPALLKYFDVPPERLYAQFKANQNRGRATFFQEE